LTAKPAINKAAKSAKSTIEADGVHAELQHLK
jgi:hypothetical protein